MKLGVSYIVFDGIELLESSIRQIRKHVDVISVIYQKVSWFNAPVLHEDLKTLQKLLDTKLVDKLILFDSFFPLKNNSPSQIGMAKEYEKRKRQVGLAYCLSVDCTHYLCMDVDEFYSSDNFIKAKNKIILNNYESTAVRFINYVKYPTLHRGYDPNRVPFICKISKSSRIGSKFFVKCDSTRGLGSFSKNYEFDRSEIIMHHMETVRKNLSTKYKSTTRKILNRSKINILVASLNTISENSSNANFKKVIYPSLNTINLTKCENIFKIPYTEWK